MQVGDFLKENINIDKRGILNAVELFSQTGEIYKRYFIISNVKGGKRGGHAHIYTDQVLKMIQGSMILKYEKDKFSNEVELDNSCPPIYLPRLTWIEKNNISIDAIILVISSNEYNIKNSIRTYDKYKKYIHDKNV